MDIIEKIEEKQADILDELGKTKPTDPSYKNMVDNLKTLNDTKTNSIREDNTRLNNNEVNDINRMKVEVEMEKVKTDRLRIGAGILSDIGDAAKTGIFCWVAYNGDKISYAIKDIKEMAKAYARSRRH